jgi:hypothetical protein
MDRPDVRRQSLSELISTLTEQLSTLMRAELALAKAELTANLKQAALGSGMLSGAALLGLTAWLVFVAAAVAGIAEGLPVWASALIVAGALAALAGLLALIGKGRLSRGMKPLPTTQDTVRSGLHELRGRRGAKATVPGEALPVGDPVLADTAGAEAPLLPEPVLPPEPPVRAGRPAHPVPAQRSPAASELAPEKQPERETAGS